MRNWLSKRPRTPFEYAAFTFYALTIFLIVLTVIQVAFEPYSWRLTLLGSLRPHFSFISLILFIGLAAKTWFRSGWLLPLAFVFALQSQPLRNMARTIWFPNQITSSIDITHLNIDRHNETPSAVFNHLNDVQPDIIFLQELSHEIADQLPEAMPAYDLIVSHPQTNTQGIGMLVAKSADLIVQSAAVIYLEPDNQRPLIEARIIHEDQLFYALSWHTIRPSHEWALIFQGLTFDSVIEWANEKQEGPGDVLILGDFNTTPWSGHFNKLLHEANLQNTHARYRSRYNTWPTQLPRWLGIPIDNAVHSTGIYTIVHKIGPDIGSDHRPVHLTLVLIKN